MSPLNFQSCKQAEKRRRVIFLTFFAMDSENQEQQQQQEQEPQNIEYQIVIENDEQIKHLLDSGAQLVDGVIFVQQQDQQQQEQETVLQQEQQQENEQEIQVASSARTPVDLLNNLRYYTFNLQFNEIIKMTFIEISKSGCYKS